MRQSKSYREDGNVRVGHGMRGREKIEKREFTIKREEDISSVRKA